MKKTAAALMLAALCGAALAQSHYVRPHVTSNGTYVEGHYRSNPDSSRLNNYSSQGNLNPYTGQQGTVNPYAAPQMPGYIAPPTQAIRPNSSWSNPYAK